MKKMTFTVPVWALNYLVNGDKTGLTLEDLALCRKFYRQNKITGCLGYDVSGETFYKHKNDISPLGSDCVDMVFSVRYTSDELFNRIVCRVDTSRGAPMGRSSSEHLPNWEKTPHFDRRVLLDSGGYDRNGGAYWGFPDTVRVKMSKDGQQWQFYRKGDKSNFTLVA